jgi:hypothetical protein
MLKITNDIDAEVYCKKYRQVAHLGMYAPTLREVNFNNPILSQAKHGKIVLKHWAGSGQVQGVQVVYNCCMYISPG